MTMKHNEDHDLEAFFDAARAAPPQMPSGLMARIVADAAVHQRPPPLWRRTMAALGGPVAMGGLVTATVAGFWLGLVPPQDTVDPLVLIGVVDLAAEDEMTDVLYAGWYSDEG
jgi:hypothetical protein